MKAWHRALDYLAVSPMQNWKWEKEPKGTLRILTRDEEPKLLKAGEELYGHQMVAFARSILETWARFGEVVKLQRADVNFDESSVYFGNTKSHED